MKGVMKMEGSQEAELVTRLVLNGTVFMVRLAGQTAAGAAKLLTFLAAAAKSDKVSGQAKLATLLRSGKELQVFTFDEAQLAEFQKEAKRYGIVYSLVKRSDKDKEAGTYDVLCKAEDAVRLNRIFENMGVATVDKSVMTAEETDEKADEQAQEKAAAEIRELINQMMQPDDRAVNPTEAADLQENQSAASSMASDLPDMERSSVAKAMSDTKKQLEEVKPETKDQMAELLMNMLQSATPEAKKPEESRMLKEADELAEAFQALTSSLNRKETGKETERS